MRKQGHIETRVLCTSCPLMRCHECKLKCECGETRFTSHHNSMEYNSAPTKKEYTHMLPREEVQYFSSVSGDWRAVSNVHVTDRVENGRIDENATITPGEVLTPASLETAIRAMGGIPDNDNDDSL